MSGNARPIVDLGIDDPEQAIARQVGLHSLFWMAAANSVGIWIALLLICPDWGSILGECSYGRWMPVHLNWQLYGWCSLPAVGILFKSYLPATLQGETHARWALQCWSLALALGGISWLRGETSGKLFLDWTGISRWVFIGALGFLWVILAFHHWKACGTRLIRGALRSPSALGKSLALAALGTVPLALYWATRPDVYPSIDPSTGGPTGASLLGSTLVIVLIFALTPRALGVGMKSTGTNKWFWPLFAGSAALFLILDHGNTSHHDWRQIAGLASLLVWIPALCRLLLSFDWAPHSRLWLGALCAWWSLLAASGVSAFLPGILDHIKFTHALVAHAHLAMAGLLSSYNALVLLNLRRETLAAFRFLSMPIAFATWHASLILHLAALAGIASVEVTHQGHFFVGGAAPLFALRLIAGIAMAATSIYWVWGASRYKDGVPVTGHA